MLTSAAETLHPLVRKTQIVTRQQLDVMQITTAGLSPILSLFFIYCTGLPNLAIKDDYIIDHAESLME